MCMLIWSVVCPDNNLSLSGSHRILCSDYAHFLEHCDAMVMCQTLMRSIGRGFDPQSIVLCLWARHFTHICYNSTFVLVSTSPRAYGSI